MVATIDRSKTDQEGDGYTLPILFEVKGHSWFTYWEEYRQEITLNQGTTLFPSYDRKRKLIDWSKPLSKNGTGKVLVNRIKQAQADGYLTSLTNLSSHSLRRGGATYLANHDAPDWLIKQLGRWRSDAFKGYTDYTW